VVQFPRRVDLFFFFDHVVLQYIINIRI